MSSSVQLQQLPSIPAAVIRRRVSPSELSRVVPEFCGRVWNVLRAQQAQGGRNLAIYWDKDIHLEAGVEMVAPFSEQDEVVRSATPSGAVASITHLGPYGTLGVAHDAIHAWCKANGQRILGPRWEIYGHWQDAWNADPSQIRTDVFYQVEKGS